MTIDKMHYVNNKELTEALAKYAADYHARGARARQGMSRYLAECLIKMSERLAMSPNFRNYTYVDDMKSAAREAALKYMHNFDRAKYDNGFAYVTQIMFSAMVQIIKKEKKKEKFDMILIQQMVNTWMLEGAHDTDLAAQAQAIADQKLQDMEDSKLTGDAKSRAGGSRKTTTRPKKKPKKADE